MYTCPARGKHAWVQVESGEEPRRHVPPSPQPQEVTGWYAARYLANLCRCWGELDGSCAHHLTTHVHRRSMSNGGCYFGWSGEGYAGSLPMGSGGTWMTVTARMQSQHMATPTEGMGMCLKKAIRYLQGYWCSLAVWSRERGAPGLTTIGLGMLRRESPAAARIPAQWRRHMPWEQDSGTCCVVFLGGRLTVTSSVGASACNGMPLRIGTGKVKHLSTNHLWVQGDIQIDGAEVQKKCLGPKRLAPCA